MKLPYMQELGNTKVAPLVFSGLNKNDIIEDTELSDGINLDTEKTPAISPRKSTLVIKKLQNPKSFMMIGDKQVYIDGTDFYFDGVKKGTVTSTSGGKSMVDFNGNVVIFPDKKYYDYVEDKFGTFECPYDIEFATVHYNRIFGIKGSDVYASKVGDFKTWDDYSGTELDSWAADVYSPGNFTGITTYQDHVVFFKRDQMYELYGYTPSQFKILESAKIGCIDNRSISEVGGVLFFMSEKGVQSYAGGFPRNVSEKLNLVSIKSAVAIGDGRKYYVSIEDEVYIYDTWQDTWMPYMNIKVISFGKLDTDIYALGDDGNIYQLESGNEMVEWEAITKLFDDGTFNKKSVKAIRLKAKMDIGSELYVYVRANERSWVLHKTIKHNEKYYMSRRDIFITIPIKRAETYQIKIVGKGNALVYGEREFIVGSDK